ncbi:MAG: hypothetical protein KF784_00010 [Fimbriimonadaceae bacterium]|nr:hypothetical protein [Fimbriimonadaceae bacterium]
MRRISATIARKVEIEVPAFARAVHQRGADRIIMTIDAFAGEPNLFYQCVWYAVSHGKYIEIAPL